MPMPTRTKRDQTKRPTPSAASQRRPWVLVGVALLVIAVGAAYLPAMQGGFVWDDDAHVTRPDLRSWEGLYRIWFDLGATQQYYPLLHSAFWIEHQLWGDQTLGYHLVNLLLHLGATGLAYLVLRTLQIPGAPLAAAIFALHPVQVESVAWITEQKNTLSATFYLGAMLAYLRFDQTRRRPLYALALALFVLGLLSKTVTATLPAALLVIFWWQRARLSWQRDVLPVLPFFVLGGAAGLFTAWAERTLIGAEGQAFDLTLIERCLLAGRVPWFYLGNLIWPANLIFIYPRWEVDPWIWWQWLFPVASVAMLIGLWLLRRWRRGPLAGWLLFVGTLFPVLGFLNVYPFLFSFVADHFQYLASLGIIVPTAAALSMAGARLVPRETRWAGTVICLAVLGTLATLTWRQSGMYRDALTLYETTIDRNPGSWMAHTNLGKLLMDKGRPQEAIEHYQHALRINPGIAEAQNNLGDALIKIGRPQEAIEHCEEALRLKPSFAEAHDSLGLALARTGRSREAIEHYLQALRLKPEFPEAHNNLGVSLASTGRPQEAVRHFEEALRLKPDYAEPRNNLGNLLADAGSTQDAMEYYLRALKVNPDLAEAHNNLGKILDEKGRTQEAIEHFQRALQITPNFAEAHNNLGAVLAKEGRPQEAIEHFQGAIQINPQYTKAYTNLALVYAQMHRSSEATAAAQKALNLARSQGQTALVEKIEDWLATRRSQHANPHDPSPRSGPVGPSR
jgi:tetratricopeptide (TPR) repeat protein